MLECALGELALAEHVSTLRLWDCHPVQSPAGTRLYQLADLVRGAVPNK